MQLAMGVVLFVLSVVAFWHAMPTDGTVRGYLRNDQVQAYYAIVLVGGLVGGVLLIIIGVASLLG